MRPVYIEQNGQKIVVGIVEDATKVGVPVGATLADFSIDHLPDATPEIRQFIDEHPFRSFNLHRIEGDTVVLRTPQELLATGFLTWDYQFRTPDPLPLPPGPNDWQTAPTY